MGEFQEKKAETGIRRRNRLHRRRDVVLDALRRAHNGDEKERVQQAAQGLARQMMTQYRRRDAHAQPDPRRVGEAIDARDRLREALEEQDAAMKALEALKLSARPAFAALEDQGGQTAAPGSSGAEASEVIVAKHNIENELRPRVEAAEKKLVEAQRAAQKREKSRVCASAKLGRSALLVVDSLEELLAIAERGERLSPIEPWDPAQLIVHRYLPHMKVGRIIDERVALDKYKDAIGFTLFARAALSEDAGDDLLFAALEAAADERLNARRPERDKLHGQSTFTLISLFVWPSHEGEGPSGRPIGREEAERRVVLDSDSRLERALRIAETAYEAVTGGPIPEDINVWVGPMRDHEQTPGSSSNEETAPPVEPLPSSGAPRSALGDGTSADSTATTPPVALGSSGSPSHQIQGPVLSTEGALRAADGVNYVGRDDAGRASRHQHLKTRGLSRSQLERCAQALAVLEEISGDEVSSRQLKDADVPVGTIVTRLRKRGAVVSGVGQKGIYEWRAVVRFVVEDWAPQVQRR